MTNSSILIYQTEDGKTKIETRLEDETVWLTIDQMAELFQKSRSTINEHILNIYAEQELDEQTSMRKIGISDFSTKPTNFYNLDVIISVGYRVKSHQGTRFRQWATSRLKEYLIKGFTMNDDLLKQAGGGNYFDELLAGIRWPASGIYAAAKKFSGAKRWTSMPQVLITTPSTKCRCCFFKPYRIKCMGRPTLGCSWTYRSRGDL